jgi:hypothetical protein
MEIDGDILTNLKTLWQVESEEDIVRELLSPEYVSFLFICFLLSMKEILTRRCLCCAAKLGRRYFTACSSSTERGVSRTSTWAMRRFADRFEGLPVRLASSLFCLSPLLIYLSTSTLCRETPTCRHHRRRRISFTPLPHLPLQHRRCHQLDRFRFFYLYQRSERLPS